MKNQVFQIPAGPCHARNAVNGTTIEGFCTDTASSLTSQLPRDTKRVSISLAEPQTLTAMQKRLGISLSPHTCQSHPHTASSLPWDGENRSFPQMVESCASASSFPALEHPCFPPVLPSHSSHLLSTNRVPIGFDWHGQERWEGEVCLSQALSQQTGAG